MKKFYGIRFLGGNRTCTTGTANEKTGNYSIAHEIQVFHSQIELDNWIYNENLYAPSGLNGGERISVNKQECRKLNLGISVEEFEAELERAEDSY